MTTTREIGERIGRAIARDVLAEDMPHTWSGLDAQDGDQIPDGMSVEEVELYAGAAYHEALAEADPKS